MLFKISNRRGHGGFRRGKQRKAEIRLQLSLRRSEELNMNERLRRMTKLTRLILIVPLAILGMVVFTAIGGGLVMLLWNWLAPTLFGLRLITFWQAIGLLA